MYIIMLKSQQKLRRKRGFSLIELIMTIVVVGIISVPLSLLISQHVESMVQSQDYTLAINLARFEMEEVNNMDYASIVSKTSSSPYKGYNYDVIRTVSFVPPGDAGSSESLKQITVTVRRSGEATDLVTLVTYIARNVSYGV